MADELERLLRDLRKEEPLTPYEAWGASHDSFGRRETRWVIARSSLLRKMAPNGPRGCIDSFSRPSLGLSLKATRETTRMGTQRTIVSPIWSKLHHRRISAIRIERVATTVGVGRLKSETA